MNKEEKAKLWSERIQEFQSSGQTCKQYGPVGVAPQCWELSVNLNELYLYTLKYVL